MLLVPHYLPQCFCSNCDEHAIFAYNKFLLSYLQLQNQISLNFCSHSIRLLYLPLYLLLYIVLVCHFYLRKTMNTYSFSDHSDNCFKILVIDQQTTNFFLFPYIFLKKKTPPCKKKMDSFWIMFYHELVHCMLYYPQISYLIYLSTRHQASQWSLTYNNLCR